MSGASDERVRRGCRGRGFDLPSTPPFVRHSPRGKARKLFQFLRLTLPLYIHGPSRHPEFGNQNLVPELSRRNHFERSDQAGR